MSIGWGIGRRMGLLMHGGQGRGSLGNVSISKRREGFRGTRSYCVWTARVGFGGGREKNGNDGHGRETRVFQHDFNSLETARLTRGLE